MNKKTKILVSSMLALSTVSIAGIAATAIAIAQTNEQKNENLKLNQFLKNFKLVASGSLAKKNANKQPNYTIYPASSFTSNHTWSAYLLDHNQYPILYSNQKFNPSDWKTILFGKPYGSNSSDGKTTSSPSNTLLSPEELDKKLFVLENIRDANPFYEVVKFITQNPGVQEGFFASGKDAFDAAYRRIEFESFANDLTGELFLRLTLTPINDANQDNQKQEKVVHTYVLNGFNKNTNFIDALYHFDDVEYTNAVSLNNSAFTKYQNATEFINAVNEANSDDTKKTALINELLNLPPKPNYVSIDLLKSKLTVTENNGEVQLSFIISLTKNIPAAKSNNLGAYESKDVSVTKSFTYSGFNNRG
ncbi:MAG1430 family protein [Mycoplasma corogypsi]|uniref:MAG1430 family protein n=1 Tax=Mycoplasma corogypsi TaxID=2106 RepID=UPI003872BD3D